jgi:pyruvate kinase
MFIDFMVALTKKRVGRKDVMLTHTKIICTIGPAVSSPEKITQLIEAGMSVARLNFSHGTHEEHLEAINHLKEARKQLQKPLAIMLDTKGPEIRIGKIQGGEIRLESGQRWLLTKEVIEGNSQAVTIFPAFILEKLAIGETILFDDGYIETHIVEIVADGVIVQVKNGGLMKSGKGVNIPQAAGLNLPAMTERDIADIRFGCQHDIDIIAASFVRSADHVLEIRKLLAAENQSQILVMAKIENREGVENFDSIVQVADGIMIARGDLGVEVPLSQVPGLQKMMIRKSYLAGKPAITATQMLESMIHNPRPTRAEVSDVPNEFFDTTAGLLVWGDTAVGKYPLETVQMMQKIIKEAEGDFNYREFFGHYSDLHFHDVPSAVALASVKAAYTSKAQAIFAFTSGGTTARLLSRLRPKMPIIAMTPHIKCFNQLAINWGVVPVLSTPCETISEAFAKISHFALDNKFVSYGDLVVITAGSPFGIAGTTNTMIVENIGDVLVRGYMGYGARIHGKVAMVLSPEVDKPYRVKDHLIVIAKCDESYLPFIREAAGVILQNHVDDVASERYALDVAKKLGTPTLVRADAACRILKEEQLVTIDPKRALVYNRILPE